jgi:hypothetical protein
MKEETGASKRGDRQSHSSSARALSEFGQSSAADLTVVDRPKNDVNIQSNMTARRNWIKSLPPAQLRPADPRHLRKSTPSLSPGGSSGDLPPSNHPAEHNSTSTPASSLVSISPSSPSSSTTEGRTISSPKSSPGKLLNGQAKGKMKDRNALYKPKARGSSFSGNNQPQRNKSAYSFKGQTSPDTAETQQ